MVYRSNGAPTYAAHDLAFAKKVSPDYYLTGAEQNPHFKSLGLGNRHIPLGLVLGPDGKKMRSSLKKEGEEANALSAMELIDMVKAELQETPEPDKLAWNILAWQFNSSSVNSSTRFNAEAWAKPEAPGLYITYTLARVKKALGQASTPPPQADMISIEDANLLHEGEQAHYYLETAQQAKEPCKIAQFALQLARSLSGRYKSQSISEGSPGYTYASTQSAKMLEACMKTLSMHPLERV